MFPHMTPFSLSSMGSLLLLLAPARGLLASARGIWAPSTVLLICIVSSPPLALAGRRARVVWTLTWV